MLRFTPERRLTGGLRLAANKTCSTAQPIQRNLIPKRLIVSTRQHRGAPAILQVEPGQHVLRGDTLASATATDSTDIHAPMSGTVAEIRSFDVPLDGGISHETCAVIETDGNGDAEKRNGSKAIKVAETPADRAAQLRAAGIAGLGGAVYPTAAKVLQVAERSCELLIINAAECEPYISCDDMLMREAPDAILDGALLLSELVDARRCVIAIERDKPEAIEAIMEAAARLEIDSIELAELPSVYPAGGERQLIEVLTGIELGSRQLPGERGILCQNVGTAHAVQRYFRHGEALTSRVVTVTGSAIAEPCNVEAMIGTPIAELIDACGGYRAEPAVWLHGGSMMGYSLGSDQLPVTRATNCIIAFAEGEIEQSSTEWPCIRCGECASVCPVRLQPQDLLQPARLRNMPALTELALSECIECGCCDVVCPSHIPLTREFRDARGALRRYADQQALSEVAERRFLLHEQRRLAAERDEQQRREALRATLGEEEQRVASIRAAVERAKQRRARTDAD